MIECIFHKLFKNFTNSLSGINVAFSDWSFRFELIFSFVLFPFLFFAFPTISLHEFFALLFTYAIILMAELFNTAIEILCDKICLNYDSRIKAVKDLASSAVFVMVLILILEIIYFINF